MHKFQIYIKIYTFAIIVLCSLPALTSNTKYDPERDGRPKTPENNVFSPAETADFLFCFKINPARAQAMIPAKQKPGGPYDQYNQAMQEYHNRMTIYNEWLEKQK